MDNVKAINKKYERFKARLDELKIRETNSIANSFRQEQINKLYKWTNQATEILMLFIERYENLNIKWRTIQDDKITIRLVYNGKLIDVVLLESYELGEMRTKIQHKDNIVLIESDEVLFDFFDKILYKKLA